ncbi:phosphatase PAP2 family protein [Candidatus Wolfebacteria bacterium]|nr:phosphatase PAP2 family protein [Candidatus Wolfebacteria bacterium]
MKQVSCWLLILIVLIGFVPTTSGAADIGKVGDIGQIALPVAAVLMTASQNDREGFYQFVKSFGATMGITCGLKYGISSGRPNGGKHSFPSGHTAAAFSGAAFIQQRYGWGYGAPAYTLAGLVGYSRVSTKNHWWRDAIAGATIGIGTNLVFTKKHEKEFRVKIIPTGDGAIALVIYEF